MILRGRIRSYRPNGGITFFHLSSGGVRTQIALTKAKTADYQALRAGLAVGYVVECEGSMDKTNSGDDALFATSVRLLAKPSVLIPEDGSLSDPELRQRSRHLDLISNQDSFERLRNRFQLTRAVRTFLEGEGFLEVETPILQQVPGGAAATPFVTRWNAQNHDYYLRIAPELYLKRLLVGGFEAVFEVGKVFRNEGLSPRHNAEFTMVEIYRAYTDSRYMIDLLLKLLSHVLGERCGSGTFVEKETDLVGRGWEFVTSFPMAESPLARPRPDNPEVADRFELYHDGVEIANGYTEENDPDAVLARMRAYSPNPDWVDEDFVQTLRAGMPPASGMGIGIDRLAMIAADCDTIRDVIAFPTLRPE